MPDIGKYYPNNLESIRRYHLMAGFLIALLSGALMSVQGVFNTQVTKTTGMWVSNAWVQLSAFAVCLLLYFGHCESRAKVYAFGRCHRGWNYLDGYPEYGRAGPRKGSASDCDCTAYCGVCN